MNYRFLIILYGILLLANLDCNAQNLVTNPSFEQIQGDINTRLTQGCGFGMEALSRADDWDSYNYSADLYFPSATGNIPAWGGTGFFDSNGPPQDGQLYAGIQAYRPYATANADPTIYTTREFGGTRLSCSLVTNVPYRVSGYFKKGEENRFTINKLGFRFDNNPSFSFGSTTGPNGTGGQCGPGASTFAPAHVEATDLIGNQWTLVSDVFVADRSYTHLLFGVFADTGDVTFTDRDNNPSNSGPAYYFVDNISVEPLAAWIQNTNYATIINSNPGDPIALEAYGPGPYNWSASDGSSVQNIQNPVVTPMVTTTYTLSVDLGCTTATTVVTVQIGNCPGVIDAGTDASIRSGETAALFASTTGATPIGYQWSPATGLDDTTIPNPMASPTVTTTYTITADFGGGCLATDSVTITVEGNGTSLDCTDANINWYFGSNAGINFSGGIAEPLTDGQLTTTEGSAAISDENGNLLFYTNGVQVYDRNGSEMPNANYLNGGGSAAQSAVIVPKPGTTDRFYIFTSEEAGNFKGLQYSEVDMALRGGLGDVGSIKNVQLVNRTTEKLITVPHSNGTDTWVIVLSWDSDEFLSYLVDATGIATAPVTSALGTNINIQGKFGTMKANQAGTLIANTLFETHQVQLFDFDAATGRLSNPRILDNMFKPYGLEFSPNGRFLYVSESDKPADRSNLFQFDLDAGNLIAVQASQTLLNDTDRSGGALQLAPDGRIYHAVFGASALGIIENPDQMGTAANYIEDGFDLAGRQSQLGLPAAAPCIETCTDIVFDESMLIVTDTNCDSQLGSIEGIQVSGVSNMAIYQWTDSEETVVGTEVDLRNIGVGNYTLTITEGDCINSLGPIQIGTPDECPEEENPLLEGAIRIANTMTPNGDGANDAFVIEGIEAYPDSRLIVYNRWGSKVFEKKGYQNDWYGMSNGNLLPVAVYYYQLRLNNNEQNIYEGYISILR